MRVIVLGAGGRVGSRVAAAAAAAGHDVTAFVRSRARLEASPHAPPGLVQRLSAVVEGDAENEEALAAAMAGHDACVQAAGCIGATAEAGAPLARVVRAAARAAERSLQGPRRLWVLAGAGVMEVPGQPGLLLMDVPGFPSKYRVHKENYEFLLGQAGTSLDWTLACPGPMYDGPPPPAGAKGVRLAVEVAPVHLPEWAACLPAALLLPALVTVRQQLTSASYEEVAAAIVANLSAGGPLRGKRVGFVGAPRRGGRS